MIRFLEKVQFTEAVAQTCPVKKMLLKILQNSQENTWASVSFLIKLQASLCNSIIKKETLTQVLFCCEFYKISKNAFSYRTPRVAASKFKRRCCWSVDGGLTWGISLAWGQVNRLRVRGNYVCCLVIVVILTELRGSNTAWYFPNTGKYGPETTQYLDTFSRSERGSGDLKSLYGGKVKGEATKAKERMGEQFLWESWPLRYYRRITYLFQPLWI